MDNDTKKKLEDIEKEIGRLTDLNSKVIDITTTNYRLLTFFFKQHDNNLLRMKKGTDKILIIASICATLIVALLLITLNINYGH